MYAQKLKLGKRNDGYIYNDGKLDSLQWQRLSAFIAENNVADSVKIQDMTNEIGNSIIPLEVRQMLKEELNKGERGGWFNISFYFDEKGNVHSVQMRITADSLFHKLSPYIEEIYDNLLEIKMDMALLENIKRSREKEKTSLNSWFLIFGRIVNEKLLPWRSPYYVVLSSSESLK